MRAIRTLFAASLMLAGAAAFAQGYPSKPVRFIVGFPAGSSIDVVSRIVMDDIRERTGAAIVVENKAGALGVLGLDTVDKAAPDGYTLMPSSSATHSSGPHLSRALQRLEPSTSMTHVARMVQFNIAVLTKSTGPYKNARLLIDAGKAKPDSLTYGYGSGTGQVSAAAFSRASGIRARAIPYKGQPAAVTDLLGGQVDFVASDIGAALAFLKQGSVTALALLADRRSSILPEVPTASEIGLTGLSLTGWIGVDGPAKLPPDVTNWWATQIKTSLAVPKVQEKLRNIGMEPAPLAGDEFVKFVASEYEGWGKHVRDAGIQPE